MSEVVGVIVTVGLVALLSYHFAKPSRNRLRREMRLIARQLGGQYRNTDQWGLGAPPGARHFVRVGDVYAYHYEQGHGVYAYTGIQIGRLSIRPTEWVDRVATSFGGEEINVSSAKFSAAFTIEAQNPRPAHALLTDEMVAHLLGNQRVAWHLKGPWMTLEANLQRWDLPNVSLRTVIEAGLKFLELIPRHVREDYGAR